MIPWNAIKGMRNVIVHGYGSIDDEILWDSAGEDIVKLENFCQRMVREHDSKIEGEKLCLNAPILEVIE